jgi:hypothetical protein
VVPGQQDKVANRELQEKEGLNAPIHIDRAVVERIESFKFLDHQTVMVQTHQDSCEEGTTTPFPPLGD